MLKSYLPFDVLNIILEYDGRIKYSHKKRIYVNIISKNDYRRNIMKANINNKLNIRKNMEKKDSAFYMDIRFENKNIGLVYDFNWSYKNEFEICYYNLKNNNRHRKSCD
jgi:hypothetical protein